MSDSLPGPGFEDLIRPYTGGLIEIHRASRGHNAAVAAVVTGEQGSFFVKAVPNRPGGRRDSLIRERLINPFVVPISPAMRWHAEGEEWIALGFEVVEGRSSDFTPDSADLPVIVETLNRIGELDLPEVARDWPETRWNRFATSEETELFAGGALLYTDVHENNLIIGGGAAWAVDWAWPTRGAAFIDPACLVVQLIAAGHTAQSAESWAAGCKAWANANPRGIDAFAAAYVRMYQTFADRRPDEDWLKAMAAASGEWADLRGITWDR